MNDKKAITLMVMAAFSLSAFTACGRYPSSDAISEEAEKIMAGEECTEIDSVKKDGTITVTYKSDERDLTFHVYGHASAGLFGLRTNSEIKDIYTPSFGSDYVHEVHELYVDDIADVLENIKAVQDDDPNWNHNTLRFTTGIKNKDLIPFIVDTLMQANEIYAEELNYHDEEWVKDNCFCVVAISYSNYDSDTPTSYAIMNIDGVSTEDYYYDILNSAVDRVESDIH